MARLSKDTVFKSSPDAKETALDKTTRIVRDIAQGELEKRQTKMARLRAARLERDAMASADPDPAPTGKAGRKTAAKAKPKR